MNAAHRRERAKCPAWPLPPFVIVGSCWVSTLNAPRDDGYVWVKRFGTSHLVHRLSYEQHCGPIPNGLQIDHVCRNRACFNPAHLRLATGAQNCQNLSAVGAGSSRHRGVSFSKAKRKWHAYARIDGQLHHLGFHATEEAARKVASGFRASHMPYSEADRV